MKEPQPLEFNAKIDLVGTLDAVVIRANGRPETLGQLSGPNNYRLIGRPVQWWRALWAKLKANGLIPATMAFSAFLAVYGVVDQPQLMHELFKKPGVLPLIMGSGIAGLVTQAGANFLASDFSSGLATPRIGSMNYHDSGTGTVAATSTDSGLGTQAGPATRATGTQTNPQTNQYKSVGTITYGGALAITEWGIFNQSAQGGTMWDRRVFSVINVGNGDSIAFTYTLTLSGGGS